ncbi:deaminase domain-containing protein [Coleofasciculus sp.]|uniref:deaminase domain-containing protein n=1 Tax=Coleofasciculus sp. TaxID=3100458 RepID=UPI0039F9211D
MNVSIRVRNKATQLEDKSYRHQNGPWPHNTNARYYQKLAPVEQASGDAEVKVLSDVTALIAAKEKDAYSKGATMQGTVVLFTNKGPCRSCRTVIQLFRTHHPGLRVIVRYMQTDAQESNTGNSKVGGSLGYQDAQKKGKWWEKKFIPLLSDSEK